MSARILRTGKRSNPRDSACVHVTDGLGTRPPAVGDDVVCSHSARDPRTRNRRRSLPDRDGAILPTRDRRWIWVAAGKAWVTARTKIPPRFVSGGTLAFQDHPRGHRSKRALLGIPGAEHYVSDAATRHLQIATSRGPRDARGSCSLIMIAIVIAIAIPSRWRRAGARRKWPTWGGKKRHWRARARSGSDRDANEEKSIQ
jgi:hypothetical protein